jgi:hypothetical protein
MIQTVLISYLQILSFMGVVHPLHVLVTDISFSAESPLRDSVGMLSVHPLHVSITDIVFDEKEKELEIVTRIFIDDLELSIRNKNKDEALNLLTPKGGQTTDALVGDYLKEHLVISLDGKTQTTKFLGSEIDDLALVCYVQVSGVKKWTNIEVRNDVIMETHDDQSNLVHVTVKGKVLSMRLTKEKVVGKLEFK